MDVADPRWGMPDALLCFVAGFVASNLGAGIWIAFSHDTGDSLGLTAFGLVGLWLGLLGSMLVVSRQKGTGNLIADFALHFRRPIDLVGVPIGAAVQVVIVPLLYAPFTRLIHDLSDRLEAPAKQLTGTAASAPGLTLLAVLVVIGAPLVEELFYRGMVLPAVERRFGSRWAILASALLFGLAHFEPLQFPALVVLGLILGVLRVRSGRLGPGIFAHAGFNAVTMIVLIATR
jgi:CAAX protease family protein